MAGTPRRVASAATRAAALGPSPISELVNRGGSYDPESVSRAIEEQRRKGANTTVPTEGEREQLLAIIQGLSTSEEGKKRLLRKAGFEEDDYTARPPVFLNIVRTGDGDYMYLVRAKLYIPMRAPWRKESLGTYALKRLEAVPGTSREVVASRTLRDGYSQLFLHLVKRLGERVIRDMSSIGVLPLSRTAEADFRMELKPHGRQKFKRMGRISITGETAVFSGPAMGALRQNLAIGLRYLSEVRFTINPPTGSDDPRAATRRGGRPELLPSVPTYTPDDDEEETEEGEAALHAGALARQDRAFFRERLSELDTAPHPPPEPWALNNVLTIADLIRAPSLAEGRAGRRLLARREAVLRPESEEQAARHMLEQLVLLHMRHDLLFDPTGLPRSEVLLRASPVPRLFPNADVFWVEMAIAERRRLAVPEMTWITADGEHVVTYTSPRERQEGRALAIGARDGLRFALTASSDLGPGSSIRVYKRSGREGEGHPMRPAYVGLLPPLGEA